MFRTLLLTTVVGAGVGSAASVPAAAAGLDARSNSPPSYFCSSSTQKCSKQRDSVAAYCSSYLSIPKVTKTQTKTVCTTKTATVTSITGTITSPPRTVTSTITSCAPPAVPTTTAAADNQRRAIEANELEERGAPAIYKPSCLNPYQGRSAIAAACKCFPVKASTTTITQTVYDKKTATRTIGGATTVPGSTTTTWVFPSPTFIVANDQGIFAEEGCSVSKSPQSGLNNGRMFFDDDGTNAILFALNADTTLTALEGSGGNAYELVPSSDDEERYYNVRIGTTALSQPLSCSVSQAPDGTCPLDCTVSSDGNDVNQRIESDVTWYLGPPNTVSDSTYKTFAVTRGDPTQRGGRCGTSRGRARARR